MSSGYGPNSKPKATSDEYRNSPYWDNVERLKREKEAKKKEDETVKVEHEGQLFIFGPSTIEYVPGCGSDEAPFKRVKDGGDKNGQTTSSI